MLGCGFCHRPGTGSGTVQSLRGREGFITFQSLPVEFRASAAANIASTVM